MGAAPDRSTPPRRCRFVDEALRLGTADALLRFHAAEVLADVGQLDRAAGQLAAAVRANPWFSFAHCRRLAGLAGRLGVALP